MISQLLEKVVQLEITISELNSKLLAQDSYILTLEDQILNLKHKLVQNSKESSSMCTQTTYDKHILETFTQTAQESSKTSKYVQTDSATILLDFSSFAVLVGFEPSALRP